jgi:lipopolysaccharide/colanic/teichoic acid biosynthesis glycosyltransferase
VSHGFAIAKRAFDVVAAATLLVVLAPLFGLLAAIVRVDAPGPVLFRALRAGRHGASFSMLKFRTMRAAAGGSPVTASGDARITRPGAWLRLFKLDELPQLVNVLAGEMSLVGPRPEDPDVVRDCYTAEQRRVLSMRPGLTGLSQVRFFPDMSDRVPAGEDAEAYYRRVQLPEKLAVDLEYVDTASLWTDLGLLWRTAGCVLLKSWWIAATRPPPELRRPRG